MRLELVDPNCAIAIIEKKRRDIRGRLFTCTEAVRAIKESRGWRIDSAGRLADAWMPWEAITGDSFATLELAQEALTTYATAHPPAE